MAMLDAISIAFDMTPGTGFIFEPEPFITLGVVSQTSTSVTTLERSLDGRQFLLQTDFILASPPAFALSGYSILDTSFTPLAVVQNVNVVVDLTSSEEEILTQLSPANILSGNDLFDGSEFNDLIFAFAGNDLVFGRGGNDVVYGNLGDDRLFGGEGIDSVFGGQGSDVVYGNLENDVVYGNLGSDQVLGGQGRDVLYGGQGDDTLHGNLGDDILVGNRDNDELAGGPGADSFQFAPNSGADVITDFQDNLDRVIITGTGANLSQQGANSLITLDSGDAVLVLNISVADLSDDVFIV